RGIRRDRDVRRRRGRGARDSREGEVSLTPMAHWLQLLRLDYRRYRAAGHSRLETLLAQGFWASSVYRACYALESTFDRGLPRAAAKALGAILQKLMEIVTGICIPDCEIGAGLYFPRFVGIILRQGPIVAMCKIEQH